MPACLVLDDRERGRKAVAAEMARQGWSVVEAATLNRALDILATQNIKLVVCDLNLPDSKGAATIAALIEAASGYITIDPYSADADNPALVLEVRERFGLTLKPPQSWLAGRATAGGMTETQVRALIKTVSDEMFLKWGRRLGYAALTAVGTLLLGLLTKFGGWIWSLMQADMLRRP